MSSSGGGSGDWLALYEAALVQRACCARALGATCARVGIYNSVTRHCDVTPHAKSCRGAGRRIAPPAGLAEEQHLLSLKPCIAGHILHDVDAGIAHLVLMEHWHVRQGELIVAPPSTGNRPRG